MKHNDASSDQLTYNESLERASSNRIFPDDEVWSVDEEKIIFDSGSRCHDDEDDSRHFFSQTKINFINLSGSSLNLFERFKSSKSQHNRHHRKRTSESIDTSSQFVDVEESDRDEEEKEEEEASSKENQRESIYFYNECQELAKKLKSLRKKRSKQSRRFNIYESNDQLLSYCLDQDNQVGLGL